MQLKYNSNHNNMPIQYYIVPSFLDKITFLVFRQNFTHQLNHPDNYQFIINLLPLYDTSDDGLLLLGNNSYYSEIDYLHFKL